MHLFNFIYFLLFAYSIIFYVFYHRPKAYFIIERYKCTTHNYFRYSDHFNKKDLPDLEPYNYLSPLHRKNTSSLNDKPEPYFM